MTDEIARLKQWDVTFDVDGEWRQVIDAPSAEEACEIARAQFRASRTWAALYPETSEMPQCTARELREPDRDQSGSHADVATDAVSSPRARAARSAERVREAWFRVLDRIEEAANDGHDVKHADLAGMVQERALVALWTRFGQQLTIEQQADVLIGVYEEELDAIDKRYPGR